MGKPPPRPARVTTTRRSPAVYCTSQQGPGQHAAPSPQHDAAPAGAFVPWLALRAPVRLMAARMAARMILFI